ncbi:splicing factor 3B subunit 1 [Dorcoceras hygrometricum]|uniref:Splicing factor 3B subunit 1 n=1 Tax=Dorcoceras hygrometricum TaxID=472368 RepID=A0A2Z7BGD0_9LAMI|nr:splicing factor 3B subunit 1 [Dorcoceras hygrometricum]
MAFEFRLLNDILAKSVILKAGSFDAVTHERFLMMSAIHGVVHVNWEILLFNIFKDMVTPASKQAREYAVQICILLKNAPDLELGESKEFPPLKILTTKTVGTYIAKNKNIFVDEDEPAVDKPREKKKSFYKKRPATTVETPVKRKRKTGRAAPEAQSLALVTVAQEVVPIQMMEIDMEEPSLTRSDDIVVEDTERSTDVNDEDDNLDGAENEIARKMASFTAPKQFLKDHLRSGEKDNMSGLKQPSKIIEMEKENESEKDNEIEPVATEDLSLRRALQR